MPLKHSRNIKHTKTILKEKGLKGLFAYVFDFMPKHNKLLLHYYPRLILTNKQYKIFRITRKYFSENYKNVIAISPLFFIKNLKKHIAWIEQDEFQRKYGNMLPIELIQQLSVKNNFNNSSMIAPPPPMLAI